MATENGSTNEMLNILSFVHQGENIRKVRDYKGVSQEELAERISVSQSAMSRYEQKRVVEDEILERVAKELGVPVGMLKYMSDEAVMNFINNTFGDMALAGYNNTHNIFNNLQPYIELANKNEKLLMDRIQFLENLLSEEKEKVRKLEKGINK